MDWFLVQFVIVTGMSGAGKSTVLRFFEDMGFFCVDNLPPSLILKFTEVCNMPGTEINRVALGIDIRGGRLFNDFYREIEKVKAPYCNILFLDCSDNVLLKRFKETRRTHPLSKSDRIENGIAKERELLADIKKYATYTIDTTNISTRQLREKLADIFLEDKEFDNLMITVLSFGFKYGIPTDADLVFDVRFITNPFYIDELKHQTGNNKAVSDYVMNFPQSVTFLEKLNNMLDFLIPNYVLEGKNQLVIAIGCTGGKHRSVTLANELFSSLKSSGKSVIIKHRDIKVDIKD